MDLIPYCTLPNTEKIREIGVLQNRRRIDNWTIRGSPAALIFPKVDVLETLDPGALK